MDSASWPGRSHGSWEGPCVWGWDSPGGPGCPAPGGMVGWDLPEGPAGTLIGILCGLLASHPQGPSLCPDVNGVWASVFLSTTGIV